LKCQTEATRSDFSSWQPLAAFTRAFARLEKALRTSLRQRGVSASNKTCPAAIAPNTLLVMRLLDRYLFRELFTPMAYCLGGFLVFWSSYDLFTELEAMQRQKLHLLDVLGYSVAKMPEFLVTILPVALLLALLYTLTNHARHNEITAMRAAGMSLWRICLPYFAVGLAASATLFALNESLVPRSTAWANQILHRYVADPADSGTQKNYRGYFNANARRLWQFTEYRAKTSEMTGPKVSWPLPNGSWRELKAESAVHTNGAWIFFNATEYEQAGQLAPELPLLATNALAMPQFEETPKDIERDIRFSKYEGLNPRYLTIPLTELWWHLRSHPEDAPEKASKWWTMLDGRLAAPWTCLVVVLIAIPFGAASGRRNLFFGVAGSIFICFGFYVVLQLCLAFGSGGYLPPWLAAWLPNMVFGGVGLLLTARVR
jgi:lipopolysaccharide export system permease protein